MTRRWGGTSFHLTQLMTGHGCFGSYLDRIGSQEGGPRCHHCEAAEDTADHTLTWCPAWTEDQVALKNDLDVEEVTLSRVIGAALESRKKWSALSKFARRVMICKERAERERQMSSRAACRQRPPPDPPPAYRS